MRRPVSPRALTVLFACCLGATRAEGQGRTASRALDSSTVRTWAALLAVHDARSADTTVIDSALASSLAPLRAAAVRVVGMNRIATRFPAVRALLTSRDTSVARDAAFALGLAADTSGCAALGDAIARPLTGVAAAWALGELGDRCGSFAGTLARARTASVRAALLRVAGKWTPFPDADVVAAHRTAVSSDERWAALYALARARRPAGAAIALAATNDPEARTRDVAARLLSASLITPTDTAVAVRTLARLSRDRDAHVRIAAFRALGTYQAPLALAPLQRAWPLERDANVRVTMAQTIGSVAPESSTVWAGWWADSTHMVRRSLIASAWQAAATRSLERAHGASLFQHPDHRIRIAMVEGAAADRSGAETDRVAPLAADPDPRVRAAAVSALGALPASVHDDRVRAILSSARADDDVAVRRAALAATVRSATHADVGIALDGYTRALRDSLGDARDAALAVIASAWRRDSAAFQDSIVGVLRALDPPRDAALRRRARGVTPLAHWSELVAAPTADRTEYERIVRQVIMPSLRGRAPTLTIVTAHGPVRILLDGVRTPMTVDHLSRLARRGYFRDLRFHRVVPAFVAQGGDPRGDGSGGPGFAIRDELNRAAYLRGAVGMALSGPDTGGSQFFLTLAPQHHLDGHYTVFGHVTGGRSAMDAIVQGDAIRNIIPSPE